MITTIGMIIAGIVALVTAVLGFVGGHKIASAKTASEVAKAQTITEATTRQNVAQETAVAAGQAQVEGAASRVQSIQAADITAAKGEDALGAALKAQGALRDD
jgi:hypothetical protein